MHELKRVFLLPSKNMPQLPHFQSRTSAFERNTTYQVAMQCRLGSGVCVMTELHFAASMVTT